MINIWLFSTFSGVIKVTDQERDWSKNLPEKRKKKFLISRSYLREMLSSILKISKLDVPLFSPPGMPPTLRGEGLGFVGISYSFNYFLIAWGPNKFGIDLEKIDRNFQAKKIVEKYFTEKEKKVLNNSNDFRSNVLRYWVSKEAAIKYDRGSLSKDIMNWELNENLNLIFNKKKNYELPLKIFAFNNHYIAIVSKDPSMKKMPFICFDNIS